ncbi:MAG: long-chain-fatty-acid--CoA ligase [Alphaproteobacteria bacterium]|nr:long-chain-fatty-acid--CoA ligase [Alphaproteobacteria bacterium]MCB9931259.1 long-chain-fatty-acid--CoA ligase [Alphaproteobacteria bacterium]
MYLTQGLKRSAQIDRDGTSTCIMAPDGGERRRTWAETVERVAKLAGAMQGLGLGAGDRAAILALNSDRYYEFFFATAWAGGVFVPINIRLAPPEVQHWLNDSEAKILFIDAQFAPVLQALDGKLPHVEQVVYLGDDVPPAGMHGYEAILAAADPAPDAECAYEDLAGLFYTGGTTGRSKGVMLSHRNLVCNNFNVMSVFDYKPGSRYLHAPPMFHIADCVAVFGQTQMGNSHYFIPMFTPEATMDAIQRWQITDTLLVPTMVNMTVNHPDVAKYDLSSLQRLAYGASPMPEAVILKAMAAIPNAQFYHAYGQTECAPLTSTNGPESHVFEGPLAYKFRSVGRSAPGVEVQIRDADDVEVPRGEVGEICVRGPNVMQGYWRQPELTAEALRGGWMHSGDGGYMDEAGYIYVVDRVKDMIISGGENIYSAEVESAVQMFPAVAECAVIGVPDDKWGERVHAIVRLKEGMSATADEIIAHCHAQIAGFKCPRGVDFITEPLPLSGAGKILKTALRQPYWEGHTKQVN